MKRLIERQKRYITENTIQPVYGRFSFSYLERGSMDGKDIYREIVSFFVDQDQCSCRENPIGYGEVLNDTAKHSKQLKLWQIPGKAEFSPDKTSFLSRNYRMTRKPECSSPDREYNHKHVINANQADCVYLTERDMRF